MDRLDLELLVALEQEGSLTAAATRLHTAQPALSRRLARIERGLHGVVLFERGRHGALATAAGREVVAASVRALDALLEVEAVGARAAAGVQGVLRLGAPPTLGAEVLPGVLAGFRRRRADVRIELHSSGDSGVLRDDVRRGTLDLALVALPAQLEHGLAVAWTDRQYFVVVVPSGDALAASGRVSVTRRQLRGRPVVALRAGEGLRLVMDSVFADLDDDPVIALETSDREMLVPAVAAGLGLTIVPEAFARQRASDATAILALRPTLHRDIGVVVRSGPLDPLVAAFIGTLQDLVSGVRRPAP